MLYSTNDQATKLDNTSFKRGASWDTRKSNCYVLKEAASHEPGREPWNRNGG